MWLKLFLILLIYRRVEVYLESYKVGSRAVAPVLSEWSGLALNFLLSWVS